MENRKGCWDNYVGAIIDKEQKCWKLPEKGEMTITLVEEAEASEHDILFFKRQDSCHELILKKLYLAEGSLCRSREKDRKEESKYMGILCLQVKCQKRWNMWENQTRNIVENIQIAGILMHGYWQESWGRTS